jgi:hypothetical protein
MTLPRSYADITKRNLTQPEETTNILAKIPRRIQKLNSIIITTKYYGAKYTNNACQENEINGQISKNNPMERQRTTKLSRRNKYISKNKRNRYSINQ